MQTSFMLAQIIGPIYLVIGLGMFLNRDSFKKLYQEFLKSPALLYLGGLFALILGMVILQLHNFWSADWSVLITLVGWLGFLKGVGLIAFPQQFMGLWKNWKIEKMLDFGMWISFGLGVVLSYFGYFA